MKRAADTFECNTAHINYPANSILSHYLSDIIDSTNPLRDEASRWYFRARRVGGEHS